MDEQQERRWRRQAIRRWLQGDTTQQIVAHIPRSARWVYKWKQRYRQYGWAGLHSQSRRPKQIHAHSAQVRQVVVRVRRHLRQRQIGRLIGARAIQREIRQGHLLPPRQRPALTSIKRIVRAAGLTTVVARQPAVPYPQPQPTATYRIQAMDWTMRYLAGGLKVYAFHSVDLSTRDLSQTLSLNKQRLTSEAHVLESWQTLGVPAAVLVDNDALWCGSPKRPRTFSRFIRLALWYGVEVIFTPFGEPQRNGVVETLNGLWSQRFWEAERFRSFAHVQRCSAAFVQWYRTVYEPPALGAHTPAATHRRHPLPHLRMSARQQLPTRLPLTAGRLHFIRLVDGQGDIRVLQETWHLDKRWAGQYVWATLVLHEQRLCIYRQQVRAQGLHLVKTFRYRIAEPIVPLRAAFKRAKRRRKMCTMC
jgi:transposase